MKIDEFEKNIRRYLLGEITEADQTTLERELLIDQDKFDQVWEFENELVDSYVQDEMSRRDRKLFEGYYLASPLHRERVAFAKLLLTSVDKVEVKSDEANNKEQITSRRNLLQSLLHRVEPAYSLILLLVILLISGAIWNYIGRDRLIQQIASIHDETKSKLAISKQREQALLSRNQELEKFISEERRNRELLQAEVGKMDKLLQSEPTLVLSYLISPTQVRSEQKTSILTIPFSMKRSRLLVQLGNDDYKSHWVKLQTVEGKEILRRKTSQIRLTTDGMFASLTLKPGELFKGDYILILLGKLNTARGEEIDRYFFRVQ